MSKTSLAKAIRQFEQARNSFVPGKQGHLELEIYKVQIADILLESFGVDPQPKQHPKLRAGA